MNYARGLFGGLLGGLLGLLISPAVCLGQGADSANALLKRYVDAIGGTSNIERIKTRITTSTIAFGWRINAKVETIQARPDSTAEHGTVGGWGWSGKIGWGYDGSVGWTQGPDGSPKRLREMQLRQRILDTRIDRDAHLEELFPSRTVQPDIVIGGKTHHVVKMSTTFGTDEIWYFDAQTGLLTQTEVTDDRGGKDGPVKITTILEDYRWIDGVRLPFRKIVHDPERTYTIEVKSVVDNTTIDASKFTSPAIPEQQ